MPKYLLSILIGLISLTGYAHQADISSTVLAQQDNDSWVLQIKSSLTAFEYEIKVIYGDSAYTTPEEFQQLVIEHVKSNTSILFDGDVEAVLEEGFVKLGHETNVIFKVKGIPQSFKNINFTNSSFKNVSRNKSALVILKKGFKQNKFILNKKNKHTVLLKVSDNELTELEPQGEVKESKRYTYILIAVVSIIALLMVFLFKIRVTNK